MSYTKTVWSSGVGDIGLGQSVPVARATVKVAPTRSGPVVAVNAPSSYPGIPYGVPHCPVITLAGQKWRPCSAITPGAKCLRRVSGRDIWVSCGPIMAPPRATRTVAIMRPAATLSNGTRQIAPTKPGPVIVHPPAPPPTPGGSASSYSSPASGGGASSPSGSAAPWPSDAEVDAAFPPTSPEELPATPTLPEKKPLSTVTKVGLVAGAGLLLFSMFGK